ncbi:MAG: hypothetical protein QNJ90_07020 [Planctomycetota bacterium]|nr:hypothetical protein [Planctomycetota bacterium]
MTRTAWIVLLLLLASNAAWLVVWFDREESVDDPFFEREALEEQVADLQLEVERLKADAGSALPGLRGVQPPPETARPGPEPQPDSEQAEPPDGGEASPDPEEAARAAALRKHQGEVLEHIKAVVQKILQVKDPGLRSEGLAELDTALRSTDVTTVEYALSALHSLRATEIDRSGFRATVLDLWSSEHAGIRRSALYALHATGAQSGDLERTLARIDDASPLVRQHLARVVRMHTGGVFEGEAASVLAKLLRDDTRDVRRGTLRALHGTTLPPAAESALIEMATRPAERREAVHHGLSQVKDKSRAVIDALFVHLGDENVAIRARSHWGLQRGIPEDQRAYVARGYAEKLDSFVNPKTHTEALKLIARFGDASVVPQLERFADNDLVDARVRELAAKAVEYLRNK